MTSQTASQSYGAEGNAARYWKCFSERLLAKLDADDDSSLWAIAIDFILTESMSMITEYHGKEAIVAEAGRCSRWIRPHWKRPDGIRNTGGYNKTVDGYSFGSTSEFDWSLRWTFSADNQLWLPISGQPSRRPLTHRIAIPGRTARHSQATIHTVWIPGSPIDAERKQTIVYGFERVDNAWRNSASWDTTHKS